MNVDIPESFTSVRRGKQLTTGQDVLLQVRRDISVDATKSYMDGCSSNIFTSENTNVYMFLLFTSNNQL